MGRYYFHYVFYSEMLEPFLMLLGCYGYHMLNISSATSGNILNMEIMQVLPQTKTT